MFCNNAIPIALVISLVALSVSNANFIERRRIKAECGRIDEVVRKDCGYGGITPTQCRLSGCCYIETYNGGIPWCFHANMTLHRTTTMRPDVTTTTMTQSIRQQTPNWLRKLLDVTSKMNNDEKTTVRTTDSPGTSTTMDTFTAEIEDELICQKTIRLYKKVKGERSCQADLDSRIPCVNGELPKERGQSECSACTKLDCCYDPMMKRSNGQIAPHCYKRVVATTTQPTTTTQAATSRPQKIWSGINPAFQPGQSPGLTQVSGNHVQKLLNALPYLNQQQPSNGFTTSNIANILGLSAGTSGGQNFPGLPQSTINTSGSSSAGNGLFGSSSTSNLFNLMSALRRPNAAGSSTSGISNLISGANSGMSPSTNLLLSLLNKPKNGTSTTSSVSNLFSLLNKPTGTTSAPSSTHQLFSGSQSSGSTTSNILNLLLNKNRPSNAGTSGSSLANYILNLRRPGSGNTGTSATSSNTGTSVSDIGNTATSSGTSGNTAGQGGKSGLTNLLMSMYGQQPSTGNSGSSTTSALLNYFLKRNQQNSGTSSTSTSDSQSGITQNPLMNNLLQNKLNQQQSGSTSTSSFSDLLASLLSGNNPTPVAPETPEPSNNEYVKEILEPLNGIPIVYETVERDLPQGTCYPQNCGHRATDGQLTHRIVGGQWTGGIEFWPWACSLRRTFVDDDRFTHICGATIIARRWILTAAHCFMAYERRGRKIIGQKEGYPIVYSLHCGKYYRDVPSASMQIYELDSFYPHPDYDFESLTNDFAVAKLTKPIRYTNYVQPVCLPDKLDVLLPEDRAWVTGWGETLHVGNQNKSKLKELTLPLISTSECRRNWPNHFHDAWICTTGAYLEDACAGDSGGPLVKRNDEGRWDLIGVAIAGTRTCSTDKNDIKPGIYSKVGYYRDFVDSITQGACEEEEKL